MTYEAAPYWKGTVPTARLRLSDAKPPRFLPPQEAQDVVNFVVVLPSWLPADCRIDVTSLRDEQPPGRPAGLDVPAIVQTPWSIGNPCSLRTTVVGNARSFRLKQFLYDWAPPAASIAPLWDCANLHPFPRGEIVGWCGIDYRGAHAACIQLQRTQVEASVLTGEFSDDELAETLRSLEPADRTRAAPVESAPFHELSYWSRYRLDPCRAPYGLYRLAHPRPYQHIRAEGRETETRLARLADDASFAIDSTVYFESGEYSESEMLFRHPVTGSQILWALAGDADAPWAMAFPPTPEDRPCALRGSIELAGTTVWVAALNLEVGPWEAHWLFNKLHYSIWSLSHRMNKSAFFHCIVPLFE